MSERAYLVEGESVRLERSLPGPIERVWQYLVDGEKRGRWLASGSLEPRVGGQVELFFRHSDLSETKEPIPEKFKAMENGHRSFETVTRFEPPHILAITWGETDGQPSEVTFELREEGDRVHLTVTHRRLATNADRLNVSGGWHAHLAILEDDLNGHPRRPFWSTHTPIAQDYETNGLT